MSQCGLLLDPFLRAYHISLCNHLLVYGTKDAVRFVSIRLSFAICSTSGFIHAAGLWRNMAGRKDVVLRDELMGGIKVSRVGLELCLLKQSKDLLWKRRIHMYIYASI